MEDARGGLILPAPAKINLSLDVLGRRPDGYHTLRSVMQTLELHDTLELQPAATTTLTCDTPALSGDDNLVVRAARLLQSMSGGIGGVAMTLVKRIPVDAGLGGGSSDAATTLLGLNRLWNLGLAPDRLAALGAELGSDVPFFFHAPSALVAGRGEAVEPLPPLPAAFVVLHRPPHGVSTARVFGALSSAAYGDGSATARLLAAVREGRPAEEWPLSNGLQETVCRLYPEVAAALERLRQAGAPTPLMTGSGSTVYALFSRQDEARRVYERLSGDGHHAILTRTAISG